MKLILVLCFAVAVTVQSKEDGVQVAIEESEADEARVSLGHGINIHDGAEHRLDATIFVSKMIEPDGPVNAGTKVDYTHKPSGEQNPAAFSSSSL